MICQVSDHAANMFRACCNLAASSSLVLYILVPSANNFTVDFSRAGKSFIYTYRKNSVGESSAPCDTPDTMGSQRMYIGEHCL